jgi:hypothetical protein
VETLSSSIHPFEYDKIKDKQDGLHFWLGVAEEEEEEDGGY